MDGNKGSVLKLPFYFPIENTVPVPKKDFFSFKNKSYMSAQVPFWEKLGTPTQEITATRS